MKHLLLILSCFILFPREHGANAQSTLPIIRANSKNVSIRDGAFLDKNAWYLNPAVRPDLFTADRTREAKYVTFYTDIDSIRVRVTPGSHFDFVILYQGKDSCYTRIQSAIPPAGDAAMVVEKSDTVPFTLTDYNAIAVKAVIDGADTVNMHFDLSGFGLRLTKDAILHKTALVPNREDVLNGKAQANYRKLNRISTLQMGTLTWHNPRISATDLTAHDMDGRFGWNLFEGKVVELNYERGILVIHPRVPRQLKGYRRSKLVFMRSFPCTTATFIVDGKDYSGVFLLDTGTDQGVIIDSLWAAQNHFPDNLPLLSTNVLHDPRGRSFTTRKVTVPAIRINGFATTQVPALLLGDQHPAGFPVNYLGNGLLKRFDLIIDFQKDELYLRPNQNG
jgi:hypothetical protein